jgi:hypothetical protein
VRHKPLQGNSDSAGGMSHSHPNHRPPADRNQRDRHSHAASNAQLLQQTISGMVGYKRPNPPSSSHKEINLTNFAINPTRAEALSPPTHFQPNTGSVNGNDPNANQTTGIEPELDDALYDRLQSSQAGTSSVINSAA